MSSDEDDEAPAPIFQPPLLAQLAADDDDDDDSDVEDGGPSTAAPAAAEKVAEAEAEEDAEEEEGSVLPSALDALDDPNGQDFLVEKWTPEFDASKTFKPPPVTAADLGPAYGSERLQMGAPNVPPPRGWQGEHNFKRADEDQRYSREYNFGKKEGDVRLRGSVCHETDDERGRRVRYGAHAALAADPWANARPVRPAPRIGFSHSQIAQFALTHYQMRIPT